MNWWSLRRLGLSVSVVGFAAGVVWGQAGNAPKVPTIDQTTSSEAGITGSARKLPSVGQVAPGFTLRDVAGKQRRSAAWQGRPVALFFLCGCSWCQDVAREWAMVQATLSGFMGQDSKPASKPLPTQKQEKTPGKGSGKRTKADRGKVAALRETAGLTVVVFAGSGDEVRSLAQVSGLRAETVLLPDPDLVVTSGLYHADPCPRVFVVDKAGIIRYVNAAADDRPGSGIALVLASRAFTTLKLLITPPVK